MPTYEYSCEKCGHNFDAFQSMRDEPFRECPKELYTTGDLLDPSRDPEAMHRREAQGLEDQEIEGSLNYVCGGLGHGGSKVSQASQVSPSVAPVILTVKM